MSDLNEQPRDYKSRTLPIELMEHYICRIDKIQTYNLWFWRPAILPIELLSFIM